MHELVRVQLIHVGDVLGDRIVIDGEDVRVTASSAQTIGMAVHELATNALKYGALSNDRGEVRIGWSAAREKGGKEMLQMLWAEEGGPAVEAPATTGFGSVVTKDMLQYSLGAEVEVDFRRTGLVWQMRCPLDRTGARGADGPAMAGQGERTPVARSPAPALRPARPKVLVV
jgi:two-component sensor histidine kinase